MTRQPRPSTDGMIHIHVASILSHSTKRGLVDLEVGEVKVQLEPAKAREIGLMLIESAEAADSDGMFYTTFKALDMADVEVLAILRRFRALRSARHQATGGEAHRD